MGKFNKLIKTYPEYDEMVDKGEWDKHFLMLQCYTIQDNTSAYTLDDVATEVQECANLLEFMGIDMSCKRYEVRFMNGRLRTYGMCSMKGLDEYGYEVYLISINEPFLRTGSPINIHNTLMHEVLHSVDGCLNHGTKWKALAAKVNRTYIFSKIKRTGADEDYKEKILEPNYKYVLKCKTCGQEWKYMRRTQKLLRISGPNSTATHKKPNGFRCPGPFNLVTL